MPSPKFVASMTLALAMTATADIISGPINSDNSKCPSDWVDVTNNNDERCCYGSLWTEDDVPYCCVRDVGADFSTGADFSGRRVRRDDDSDCWPFCSISMTGSLTNTLPLVPTGAPSCVTKVPFSASDYSKLVSSASSSIASSSPASNDASQTSTGFATSTSDSSATSSSGSDSSTDTSTNAAMPVRTAESMMFGGAAMAAALLAL